MAVNRMVLRMLLKEGIPPLAVCEMVFSGVLGTAINFATHLRYFILKNTLMFDMFHKIELDFFLSIARYKFMTKDSAPPASNPPRTCNTRIGVVFMLNPS